MSLPTKGCAAWSALWKMSLVGELIIDSLAGRLKAYYTWWHNKRWSYRDLGLGLGAGHGSPLNAGFHGTSV